MPSLLVSIVLPVYNCEKYITECLESIVTQTYKNWELIIIDDGSTDSSDEIISAFILKVDNHHVNYIKLSHHGFTYCLNYAIKISSGKYIARIDADDIMLPERLEKQLLFLEEHPEIGILGTNAYEIDEEGIIFSVLIKPKDDINIKKAFSYDCAIVHPSVMIRKFIFDNYLYDEINSIPEDLELWIRIKQFTLFENLQEPLIKKRKHLTQMTNFKNRLYIFNGLKFSFLYNTKNREYFYAAGSLKILILLILPSSITQWLKKLKYQQKLANYQQSILQ